MLEESLVPDEERLLRCLHVVEDVSTEWQKGLGMMDLERLETRSASSHCSCDAAMVDWDNFEGRIETDST